MRLPNGRHFGRKFEANAALAAKLAIRRPLDGILEAKRPPKGAKRRPSWRQDGAKMEQKGSKKACKVASKNSMRKRSPPGANLKQGAGSNQGRAPDTLGPGRNARSPFPLGKLSSMAN